MPHLPTVLRMMWRRSSAFVKEAGTVILGCTVVLWFLLSFPRDREAAAGFDAQRDRARAELQGDALTERLAQLDGEQAGSALRASYGARLGHAIEPTIAPLGFDWKIGIGLVGAFAAREVFVSTMGVVYGLGDAEDDGSVGLRERIRAETYADGRPVYSPLVGLSLMVFFALACQCVSTLAVVRRETRTWRWPAFLFAYTLVLAWCASFAVFQIGSLL
jgi:ferrous iron transport protein B